MGPMFADQLRSAREARGVSKYRLAQLSGVSESLLSRFELGKRIPGLDAIAKLAEALGVPFADLKTAADHDRIERMGLAVPPAEKQASVSTLELVPIGHMGGVTLPAWRISCGDMMSLETTPDALESWPAEVVGASDAVMTVVGTSMLGCGFRPGDKLFVRMLDGRRPPPGAEVVARVGDGYTCKVFRKDQLGAYLEAQPGEGEPWRVPLAPDVQLVAEVVGVYSPRGRR